MSLHLCPIEPDDWSNGNGEEGNCRACDGTGVFNREAGVIDGIYYDEIQDATCDAWAEVGAAWSRGIPIIGLHSKGEQVGLMRRMVNWFHNYRDLLAEIDSVLESRIAA